MVTNGCNSNGSLPWQRHPYLLSLDLITKSLLVCITAEQKTKRRKRMIKKKIGIEKCSENLNRVVGDWKCTTHGYQLNNKLDGRKV